MTEHVEKEIAVAKVVVQRRESRRRVGLKPSRSLHELAAAPPRFRTDLAPSQIDRFRARRVHIDQDRFLAVPRQASLAEIIEAVQIRRILSSCRVNR